MSRFDNLVAIHRSENIATAKAIDNSGGNTGNNNSDTTVPLSLNAVEKEQQQILDKAYGYNINHINYNQGIQSMREQNAKMAASLGYISPPQNDM